MKREEINANQDDEIINSSDMINMKDEVYSENSDMIELENEYTNSNEKQKRSLWTPSQISRNESSQNSYTGTPTAQSKMLFYPIFENNNISTKKCNFDKDNDLSDIEIQNKKDSLNVSEIPKNKKNNENAIKLKKQSLSNMHIILTDENIQDEEVTKKYFFLSLTLLSIVTYKCSFENNIIKK